MARIKLCGMMKENDIFAVNELNPEYVGFIFWEKSFRNLTYDRAKQLKGLLSNSIDAVGVFVDADLNYIARLANDGIIDLVQLHGSEDEEYIRTLRKIVPIGTKIIKAYKVTNADEVAAAVSSIADFILFDPGKGNGNTFNWELIKDVERPYFLAGGLNTDNIGDAMEYLHPFAVDVSSGIETNKSKDVAKMKKFVSIARSLH